MKQHCSQSPGEGKRKLLFELEKKECEKLKCFQNLLKQMNQRPQCNQSGQR